MIWIRCEQDYWASRSYQIPQICLGIQKEIKMAYILVTRIATYIDEAETILCNPTFILHLTPLS